MDESLGDRGPLRRLGDFEIVRELGRGGMGIVYEARQVSLNRKIALKVLSGSLGLTTEAVLRFQREAEAAARLHHTNIAPIYAPGRAVYVLMRSLCPSFFGAVVRERILGEECR
jgi:serine/threonine protein kinase